MSCFKRIVTVLVFILLYSVFTNQKAHAASLYLSPGSGKVGLKGTMTVQVRLNTQGEAINGVSAFLSYPTDKLDVAYVSKGGSFAIEAEKVAGGGIIKVSVGNFTGVSGNAHVATIGFRGKALGNATVSFTGGSAAKRASDSSEALSGTSGGTYTVVESLPSPTPAPAAKISDIQISNISSSSATVTWKTDQKTDTLLEYGLEKGVYFLQVEDQKSKTEHTATIESNLLKPGLTLHFRIKAKNASDSTAESADQIIQMSGYDATLTITDKSIGAAIQQAEVTIDIDKRVLTTNQNGEVTFKDITDGPHVVGIKTGGGVQYHTIVIAKNPKAQRFSIQVSPAVVSGGNSIIILAISILAIAGFAVVAYLLYMKVIKSKQSPLSQQKTDETNTPPSFS